LALQSQLTESNLSLHQATIGVPMKAMAESMSTVPDLFLEQLQRHYKVEIKDGSLTLQTADGKPVTGKDGKNIPFERQALTELLTTGDDARAKTFKAITIVNRASGAANISANNHRGNQPMSTRPQFGLGNSLQSK